MFQIWIQRHLRHSKIQLTNTIILLCTDSVVVVVLVVVVVVVVVVVFVVVVVVGMWGIKFDGRVVVGG